MRMIPDRRVFLRYSISADQWQALPDTPGPQGAGDAIAWCGYDNKVYALLGSSRHGTTFANYDPVTNTWTVKSSPPGGIDDGCSLVWAGANTCMYLRANILKPLP
jgi:hypothetical protein